MISFLLFILIFQNLGKVFACEVNYKVSNNLYVINENIKLNFNLNDCPNSVNVRAISKDFLGKLISNDQKTNIEINSNTKKNISIEPEMFIKVEKIFTTPINLFFEYSVDTNLSSHKSDDLSLMVTDTNVQIPLKLNIEENFLQEPALQTTAEGIEKPVETVHFVENPYKIVLPVLALVFSAIGLIMLKYTNAKV